MPPTQAAINTLFRGSAAATSITLGGSIQLYSDPYCKTSLSSSATSILLGDCYNALTTGVGGIYISSFPACPDDTTPLLLISNEKDCKTSAAKKRTYTHPDQCQAFSSSIERTEVTSAEFMCYPRGGNTQDPVEWENEKEFKVHRRKSGNGGGDDGDVEVSVDVRVPARCCCTCVVM